MKKKEWKKKYKKLYKKYLILNQHSLQYCSGCAWNAIIPGIGCLNCQHWERQSLRIEEAVDNLENKDQLGRTLPLEGHNKDCPHGQTGWATCTCEYP